MQSCLIQSQIHSIFQTEHFWPKSSFKPFLSERVVIASWIYQTKHLLVMEATQIRIKYQIIQTWFVSRRDTSLVGLQYISCNFKRFWFAYNDEVFVYFEESVWITIKVLAAEYVAFICIIDISPISRLHQKSLISSFKKT